MKLNLRKLGIFVALTMVLMLGALLLAFYYIDIGLTGLADGEARPAVITDLSEIPESVTEDASAMAMELYGDYYDKYDAFVNQLLTVYVEAKDSDCVVIFNPGGWGNKMLASSPGWYEICQGIESELDRLGYSSLVFDYQRTDKNIRGINKELVELFSVYPSKAKSLAGRVEFLTRNIPELKVIVAGESNGSIISDTVVDMLQDNPRVYSIQTGPPFWHKRMAMERTLVLESNGRLPDSFSHGDIFKMVITSLKALVGVPIPEDEAPGRIFYFLRAPGHDYFWRYPGVNLEITGFLEENFGSDRHISNN